MVIEAALLNHRSNPDVIKDQGITRRSLKEAMGTSISSRERLWIGSIGL
jgi:hypothetical protein